MMKKYLPIVLVLMLGSMGFAQESNRELVIPKLGFSMKLPVCWKTESKEKNRFYDTTKRDERDGWVAEYSLGGKSLNEFVEASLKDVKRAKLLQKRIERVLGEFSLGEEGSQEGLPQIRSKTAEKINGLEAIEVVCEGEYCVMDTFIRKGDKVLSVTFRTWKGDFPRYQDSFRQAIQSIVIGETRSG